MNTISPTEVQAEFADALQRVGLRPGGAPIMDGCRHRVPVESDRRGRQSGTYIGHLDGYPAGYIHNFKTGEEVRWRASRPYRRMSPEERARERARVEAERTARAAERQHREAVTAHRALAIWSRAQPVRSHPYLAGKGVASHGLRQYGRGNLLVPMCDVDGTLWGVQSITPEGGKFFLKGGRKRGMQAVLGVAGAGEPLVITEGYATAATLREVTGLPIVAAFDGGNLLEVARAHRERDPGRTLIIAGDDDHHLPRREVPLPNVGREKAQAAVAEVGATLLIPTFGAADAGSDWNDFAAQHGRDLMRQVVEAVLREQGITLPAKRQVGAVQR